MKKVKLILGTHNSQPLGLSEKGIEEAYQSAYKPFLSLMYSYPTVNLTLYYTGILLKWFQDNHPEFLMLLNEMIKRKQVELLGGGFYEPVFSLIPPRDRAGQIEKLTTFIRKRFGRRPRGIWITERVWEPNLPITLRGCGMEYTFLDDTHLRSAGLREEELSRPCLTEDQGKTLSVVPITTDLCRCHSSVEPDELIGRILEHPADDEDSVLVLMEEGEEFGMREGSSRRYYEERRLKDFLDLLVDRRDRILTVSAGTHVKDSFPGRKVYIPCTSNGDLMRWSRPTACGADRELGAHDPKVNGADIPNGGFFRQFLSIYPESNLLYAKMMDTHILVDQVRGDKQRKRAATEELWKGESNFPYWHGRSGGLYRNELRKRAYGALIEAERVTRERGIFKPSVSTEDFDMDGQLE